jgi:hypothetical protein
MYVHNKQLFLFSSNIFKQPKVYNPATLLGAWPNDATLFFLLKTRFCYLNQTIRLHRSPDVMGIACTHVEQNIER